ncbi:NAD(P)/FAD-dependent oxidoreductase [Terricaulis sp.]|uniref:NAD(P)/FAD-dependent oxidoreductase n=1 Tax=Terricaulis sp. TaxID=2768686 RepID=UPI0037843DB2
MSDFDAAIVGAGAVGLACAYAIARRGKSVIVIERDVRIGGGISSRNSEVIHAGLHYATGSLKARLCVEGRRALYPFLTSHNIAHKKCGKLIVATEEGEISALHKLRQQGELNGVEGVRYLQGDEAKLLEPNLRVAAALESPESGILDSHGYMLALQGEIESHGGAIALNAPFEGAAPRAGNFEVRVGGADPTRFTSRQLVISAGLGAQACASGIDGFPAERIPELYFGKGNYFMLTGVKAPFARLIYPPPIPGALGTHYRRDLGGIARFGPDLEFVATENYAVDPTRAASFYETVRRFWPGLPDGALAPDYAGIRPKLHGPGEAQGDFVIDSEAMENVVALFGIESPGLTSSLAIGEEVAKRLTH